MNIIKIIKENLEERKRKEEELKKSQREKRRKELMKLKNEDLIEIIITLEEQVKRLKSDVDFLEIQNNAIRYNK